MFTFVTGGLRSGKSGYALARATELGPPPWAFVASSVEGDDESMHVACGMGHVPSKSSRFLYLYAQTPAQQMRAQREKLDKK